MVAVVAFALGHFVFDDSDQVQELQSRLEKRTRGGNAHTGKPMSISGIRSLATMAPRTTDDLTPEDWALTRELERRRAEEGEYVLYYETPDAKKAMERLRATLVSSRASTNAEIYSQLFQELGLSSSVGYQLSKHVEKIHRASLEAEATSQQLGFAKADYKRQLQSLLTEEDYRQYLGHEESKRATAEARMFQDFSARQNAPVDSASLEAIVTLIQDSRAFTEMSWHGPLDELPQFAVGATEVTSQIATEISQIADRLSELAGKASQSGISDEHQALLEDYYADRMQQKQRLIDKINNPPLDADAHHPPAFVNSASTPATGHSLTP